MNGAEGGRITVFLLSGAQAFLSFLYSNLRGTRDRAHYGGGPLRIIHQVRVQGHWLQSLIAWLVGGCLMPLSLCFLICKMGVLITASSPLRHGEQ